MEEIKVRVGSKADIDSLAELSQVWCEKDKAIKKQMLEQCFNLPNYKIFVAECNGVIVGWLSAYLRMSWVNAEKRLFIGSVFTHPNYRKRGVMRKLWNKIEETLDYDVALVDTRLEYPLHLGFEFGTNKMYFKRKVKT